MHTIRPILWTHKPNLKGLFPLMIAVTIDRKIAYFKTPFRLKKNQWNGEIINYTNSKIANASVRKQINDLENDILARQMGGEVVTVKSLKKPKSSLVKNFAIEVKGKGVHNYKEINRLEIFSPGVELKQITVTFLRKYEQAERVRGMSQNTVNTTFKWLRRIMGQAKKEKLIQYNPFDDYTVPRYEQTDRVYLTDEEKQKIFDKLDQYSGEAYKVLCYFLYGCYSGLRQQDWMKFSPDLIEDGFLKLRATKNKRFVVLPIGPTLEGIISRLKKIDPCPALQTCNDYLRAIGSAIGIQKKLSTHVGRHSFGYMCAKNKIPRSSTAHFMGISERVVSVYYHLAGEDVLEHAAILRTV